MAVDGFNPPLVIPEYVLVCEVSNGNTPTETREAVFVHACTMAPECRSSAYIQTINAATNVEIFLRNGCHFPMLIWRPSSCSTSHFIVQVHNNTRAARLLQSKFNRSLACMRIHLFDKRGVHWRHNVFFFPDANFIRQWGHYHYEKDMMHPVV